MPWQICHGYYLLLLRFLVLFYSRLNVELHVYTWRSPANQPFFSYQKHAPLLYASVLQILFVPTEFSLYNHSAQYPSVELTEIRLKWRWLKHCHTPSNPSILQVYLYAPSSPSLFRVILLSLVKYTQYIYTRWTKINTTKTQINMFTYFYYCCCCCCCCCIVLLSLLLPVARCCCCCCCCIVLLSLLLLLLLHGVVVVAVVAWCCCRCCCMVVLLYSP